MPPKKYAKKPLATNPESNEDSDTDRKKTFKLSPSPATPSLDPLEALKAAAIIARTEQAAKIYSEQSQ